jgi:hypothetical protein
MDVDHLVVWPGRRRPFHLEVPVAYDPEMSRTVGFIFCVLGVALLVMVSTDLNVVVALVIGFIVAVVWQVLAKQELPWRRKK